MDEFRIPLSEIIELAKTQACAYYLESRHMAKDMSRNRWDRFESEKEVEYWDKVDKYLGKLQERRLHP